MARRWTGGPNTGKFEEGGPCLVSNIRGLNPEQTMHPRGGAANTVKMQEDIDNQRIRSLAQGLLRVVDSTYGGQSSAIMYYAPSRSDEAGKWVTMATAQSETGLYPQYPEAEVYDMADYRPQIEATYTEVELANA